VLWRARGAAHGALGAAATQNFALALRLAPLLPFAETDAGELLLAKGDLAGATEMLARAHEKSPHFADPLELWGEALARKGDLEAALAKFHAAAVAAPNWGRLHLQWGLVLDRLGRRSEAAAQFRLARSLDLSPADRQTLAGR
jgi:tetratricopeptide (TPR) repeat protein